MKEHSAQSIHSNHFIAFLVIQYSRVFPPTLKIRFSVSNTIAAVLLIIQLFSYLVLEKAFSKA